MKLFVITFSFYCVLSLEPLPKYISISDANLDSFNKAETFCENNYGIPGESGLATILNSKDNSIALQVCKNNPLNYPVAPCGIGISDFTNEGVWKWIPKGISSTYTNWHDGEPNNDETNKDCAFLNGLPDGLNPDKWISFSCDSSPGVWLCNYDKTNRGYIRGDTKLNWLDSYTYCKIIGTTLASITDERDAKDAARKCGNGNDCWLGYNDISKEGTFKWLDNTNTGYENWYPGQLNNYETQHCVRMYGTETTWNDADCITDKAYPLCNPINNIASSAKINDFNINKLDSINDDSVNSKFNLLSEYNILSMILQCILILIFLCFGVCLFVYVKKIKISNYNKVSTLTETDTI